MGGTAVILRDYDPSWPDAFAQEEARLRVVLGDAVVRLHHAGSTSVPGLAAKPVIDVIAEVTSLADLDACRAAAEAAGYVWKGEYGLPRRRYLTSEHPDWPMEHSHVHAWATGDPQIRRHLAFRDALRASDALAAAYAQLKWQLRDRYPNDRHAYTDGKTDFIERTVREHGPPVRVLVRCERVQQVLDDRGRDAALRLLGPAERARLDRTGPAQRDAYLAGAALVRSCLSEVSGQPVDGWTFRRSPLGKPVVSSPAVARGVHFSLSHAGGRVACAVADGVACGVDVAAVEPVEEDGTLVRSALGDAERADWLGLDAAARDTAFWRVWALKEALTKALGTGLRSVLPHVAFDVPTSAAPAARMDDALGHVAEDWRFRLLDAPAGFVLAVAVGSGRGVRVEMVRDTGSAREP